MASRNDDELDLQGELLATLDDGRLSRSERKGLRLALEGRSWNERRRLLAAAFDALRERMHDGRDRELLDWLEEVTGALLSGNGHERPRSRAWFGPGEPLAEVLASLLAGCRESLDAAIYTVTDDRIAGALLDAHRRGVAVRLIVDDEKAQDPGSDVHALRRAGVPVLLDPTDGLFHHKFAVLDGRSLVTGSYNWTRSGAGSNQENFLHTFDPGLVALYARAFERMWRERGGTRSP